MDGEDHGHLRPARVSNAWEVTDSGGDVGGDDGAAAERRPPVDVVVVDDHPLFARGLSLLLPEVSLGRVRVVGTTDDASAAAALVQREHADVAVVDLHMPPPGGTRAIAAIRRVEPTVRVVALSGLAEPDAAVEALRAGAAGFLPKTAGPEQLVRPLLAVLDGWSVLPEALLRRLLDRAAPEGDQGVVGELTADERRLWRLVAAGAGTLEIAATLHVSERTAKRLVAGLLRRLRVATRVEAAALAGRVGLDRRPAG
ncbi:response regulator transcription factor [Geodermatophilus sp. YIM 151500]|uniref:response regulator transcription factor n=1 Tax=Geodermatophilus sp. YIM 151500 TaxID=2984531 RepID=UPI0021E4BC31|nr:response regulator transcription factor [Geodermatophilus sp. YIM 151500]MCV2490541.1 response regulator transcription factor [Geodermatophilus sp. YIM 151500]